MRRRGVVVFGVVAACAVAAVLAVGQALNPPPPPVPSTFTAPTGLPRSTALSTGRFVFDSDRSGNFELYSMPATGGSARRLTSDARYDSWSPRLSPDRRTILFHRTPKGVHDLDSSKVSIWVAAADGTGVRELRPPGLDGWYQQGHAEWSPDGASLVLFGGTRISPQIWVTDAFGGSPRQVTDRSGTNLDPAFTPDGRSIVFVGCAQAICTETDYEVYRVGLDGRGEQRVTSDDLRDHDPVMSPDGTKLAWLTAFGGPGVGTWDIRVADASGSSPRRLVGDDAVTSRPEWLRDGSGVLTHRIAPGRTTFGIYRVGLDGTLTELTKGQPGTNEYPSP